MRIPGLAALAALALGSAAWANANDDGNAGLKALQAGDNDSAIVYFTRAINSHRLRGDDLEFAYANRGQAYLNKQDRADAIVDLDQARQLKPDDADVQHALSCTIAAELPASLVPGQGVGGFFAGIINQAAQDSANPDGKCQ